MSTYIRRNYKKKMHEKRFFTLCFISSRMFCALFLTRKASVCHPRQAHKLFFLMHQCLIFLLSSHIVHLNLQKRQFETFENMDLHGAIRHIFAQIIYVQPNCKILL